MISYNNLSSDFQINKLEIGVCGRKMKRVGEFEEWALRIIRPVFAI